MNHGPLSDGPGCRWARPRLALLAGDDLAGEERRKVERHLITCPACQSLRASFGGALDALHASATIDPTPDAPGLWPAIARRIREEKHAPRPSALAGIGDWLDAVFSSLAPPRRLVLGGSLSLAVAVGALVNAWADRRTDDARASDIVARRPLPEPPLSRRLPPPPTPSPSPEAEMLADAEPRLYDLDHGAPMNPDGESAAGSY